MSTGYIKSIGGIIEQNTRNQDVIMDSEPLPIETMANRGTSIRFEIDADLKSEFQKLCNLKQTNMTDVLTKLIEKEVTDGQDILKLFAEVGKNA